MYFQRFHFAIIIQIDAKGGKQMDPISHAIVGLAAFSLFNTPAIGNPACIGAIVGAIAPDFDIVARIKGDYVYLKHHRVESHSVPGAIGLSIITTLILSFVYRQWNLYEIFLWTLIGTASHILMDLFNSYGVALLYPLNRKKYSLNLLMIYDPLVILMSIYIIFFSKKSVEELGLLAFLALIYLILKHIDKSRLKDRLSRHFQQEYDIQEISVMPSTLNPLKWDYIINTSCSFIVGEIFSLRGRISLFRSLKKVWSPIIEKSLAEELGIYFKSFSPIFHIDIIFKEKLVIKLTDLRYRIRNDFMHSAYLYYDEDERLVSSEFQPFGLNRKIKL